MNKLRYYFASKRLLKAQAVDLGRQLQEAWEERDAWKKAAASWRSAAETTHEANDNITEQLHRVARERDECYRQKRLADIRRKKDNG